MFRERLEAVAVCGRLSLKGKKSLTTKCLLPSGSEMALEKINTLLPPDVLHAIVSLC